ncbi:hypothetical protein C7B62_20420 [Pleurocapsa sp. CCALA 161]|jgi:uncharacterized protein|uniref:BrnT family toxin n=1 Tax=Pleurocapsa sp. CCALA 161 TaxID=2107688 RepID=UPI000D07B322|nr:BrnT family toxin [Pleurocapsa sp. CCALA 161]PSB07282.1 hypothetical protein C7B62_20420 [Pleurocapsa sp. CCALA 161]
MEFEWDEYKNQSNQQKHDISFEEASEIFRYPMYEIADNRQDYGEVRYVGIGRNNQMLVLTVVFTERESRIRIISARRANKNERKLYYEYCT